MNKKDKCDMQSKDWIIGLGGLALFFIIGLLIGTPDYNEPIVIDCEKAEIENTTITFETEAEVTQKLVGWEQVKQFCEG